MYPVSANFHTLAIQDAPKTRVRIYFIGDAVDCTDDNAVQTNGTLLIGKAGDTDSNGRIGQNGVVFNELFNPDKNIQIGRAVSSQIGMTLLNTDGALDNFQYGRCKVYLDVYDTANSSWLACPMGVYIIELPTKRKVQLINAVGFDQMTKLDAICDTWWNGLNWSGGLTLLQIVNSMATQLGVSVSSNTASAIVNSSLTFTAAPFDCVEVTYREVLEVIAEATGTVARFDRNGALDLRYFELPTINGMAISIDTDTVGNQCLALNVAEYNVSQIDLLRAKFAEGDIGVTVGSGTNEYVITNNLFLNGANTAAITNKLTPIYNRLYYFIAQYTPVSGRFIWDWSIEAGDMVDIVNDGTIHTVPIFQQAMTWRGGYVVSDLICDGDKTRPVLDSAERDYYRLDSDMRTLVIEAPRINLLGYTTINNGFRVNLDGTFEANGATINGNLTSVDPQTGLITKIENGELTVVDSGYTVAEIGSDGQTGARISLESPVDGWKSRFDFGGLVLYDENNIGRFVATNTIDGNFPQIKIRDSGGNNVFSVTDTETTINCVLDITPRRCEATLSSAGWHRAIVYNAYDTYSAQGSSGEIVTIKIVYTSDGSVQHEISLFMTKGKVAFLNETSRGTTNLVDKIRYTYAGSVGYVDIHTTSSSSLTYNVSFEVASRIYAKGRWVAGTLASVAASPSGETVLTEYTFSNNTDIAATTFTPTSGSSYATYSGCFYERKNGLTHVHIGVSGLAANTTTTVYTLPSDVRPSTRIASAGIGGTLPLTSAGQIYTSGVIYVNSAGTYAMLDFWYF